MVFAATEIIHNSDSGIELKYTYDGTDDKIVYINEYFEPGSPEIPYRFFRIGIPPGSQVSTQLIDVDFNTDQLDYVDPLLPLENTETATKYYRNDAIYSSNNIFPTDWLKAGQPVTTRGREFVNVYVPLFRWNPVTHELQTLKKAHFNVTWSGGAKAGPKNDPYFEEFFRKALINYDIARTFTIEETKSLSESPFASGIDWYRFRLKGGGVYSLSYETLLGDVLSGEIETSDIHIFSSHPRMLSLSLLEEQPGLLPVGAIFEDGGDGNFGPGDEIVFPVFSTTGSYRRSGGSYGGYINYYDTLTTVWIAVGEVDFERYQPVDIEVTTVDTFVSSSWTFQHSQKLAQAHEGTWYWESVSDFSIYITDPTRISTAVTPNLYVSISPTPASMSLDGRNMGREGLPAFPGTSFSGDISPTGANRVIASYSSDTNLRYYQKMYFIDLKPESGKLRFSSCDSGVCRYNLSGFADPIVWDITDLNTTRLLRVHESPEGHSFIDTLHYREYLVCERQEVTGLDIDIDAVANPGELYGTEQGADYLILTPEQFDLSAHKEFRENYSGYRTKIVYLEDIYRDFGFGNPDPTAVRNFLRFAYENWPSPAPSYVLLVGDSHYDFVNRFHDEPIYFPMPYEASYYSDEYYVTLTGSSGPDMYIGRFSAKSQHDVDVMVQKTIEYETDPEYGFWRVEVMAIADDEYKGDKTESGLDHTDNQSILLDNYFGGNWDPIFIYEIDYPLNSQRQKPSVNQDIMRHGLDGVVYMNYVGHGSQLRWAHEDVFNLNRDIPEFMVGRRLPIATSFSCDVARYFLTWTECMAEEMVRIEGGGAIGVLAATSGSYPTPNKSYSRRFFDHFLMDEIPSTIGQASYDTKGTFYPGHDAQYILFGDPAVRLPYPELSIELECPDTMKGRELYHVSGRVTNSEGDIQSSYRGKVAIKIRDASFERFYQSPESGVGSATYKVPGVPVFFGTAEVIDGQFELTVLIPGDVFVDKVGGSVLAYAWNDDADAVGHKTDIFVTRGSNSIVDSEGPNIELWFNSEGWTEDKSISRNSILYLELSDESGINITGINGHQIAAYLDGNSVDMIDLTDQFEYFTGSYTTGSLTYQMKDIEVGEHTMTVVAWDNLGNSSTLETRFDVNDSENSVFDIVPYPAPFSEWTDFTFGLTGDGDVRIDIFTLSGHKVRHLEKTVLSPWDKLHWDGNDSNGEPVANGTYIYVVEADFGSDTVVRRDKISKLH